MHSLQHHQPSPETKSIINIMTEAVKKLNQPIPSRSLGYILAGLRHHSDELPEVRIFLSALAEKINPFKMSSSFNPSQEQEKMSKDRLKEAEIVDILTGIKTVGACEAVARENKVKPKPTPKQGWRRFRTTVQRRYLPRCPSASIRAFGLGLLRC
jgi:hypothetical protein